MMSEKWLAAAPPGIDCNTGVSTSKAPPSFKNVLMVLIIFVRCSNVFLRLD